MNTEMKNQEAVIQNLKDAGCKTEQVEAFLEIGREGDVKRQMKLLERHRQALLEAMHQEQRRIDCLDYLLFQMKRGASNE